MSLIVFLLASVNQAWEFHESHNVCGPNLSIFGVYFGTIKFMPDKPTTRCTSKHRIVALTIEGFLQYLILSLYIYVTTQGDDI